MTLVLVLRPEPGAGETAARARALGLDPVVAPLFRIEKVAWEAPAEESFDALLLTSANAARCAGAAPRKPCYAVGEATAEAARSAGFDVVDAGHSDGAAAVERMARAGIRRALHLCGRDHIPLHHPALTLERRI
ncbi:MAG TPA: uroporphyrinogen-III synthase, partial [Geminicoccaceae bacterium]